MATYGSTRLVSAEEQGVTESPMVKKGIREWDKAKTRGIGNGIGHKNGGGDREWDM